MKDFIPTEEDFEVLLASLLSHERALATEVVISEALSRVDLTNVEAFEKAFSDPPKDMKPADTKRILAETTAIRDQMTLLKAKLIGFRNLVRNVADRAAVEDLLK